MLSGCHGFNIDIAFKIQKKKIKKIEIQKKKRNWETITLTCLGLYLVFQLQFYLL